MHTVLTGPAAQDDLEAAAKYDRMLTNLWKEHKAANGDAKVGSP
jgi:hypothetical protein